MQKTQAFDDFCYETILEKLIPRSYSNMLSFSIVVSEL